MGVVWWKLHSEKEIIKKYSKQVLYEDWIQELFTAVETWGSMHSMWKSQYRNDPEWVKGKMDEVMQEVTKVKPAVIQVDGEGNEEDL